MKAKRKLSDIDFSAEGAHVALTHKSQGYSANGKPLALVLKSRSKEFIEKAQQIQVTMEVPEFLRKFFGLYYEDAEVLARLMGYVPPEKEEEAEWSYEGYIQEKLDSYTIIKSLKGSDNLEKSLAALSDEDYIKLLKDQKVIEQFMLQKSTDVVNSTDEDDASIGTEVKNGEVDTSIVKKTSKEETMSDKNIEMVEKAAHDLVQKSLEDAKAQLEKANATIAEFKEKEKEAIVKAKSAKVAEVVDAKYAEIVTKAALALEASEDFDKFVDAMKQIKEVVEKSALFQEQGASGEGSEQKQTSGVRAILEKQFASK